MKTPSKLITCPMCGWEYDPVVNSACKTCPLNRGCTLACCPNCGYETVDPGRSRLAGLLQKIASLAAGSDRDQKPAP